MKKSMILLCLILLLATGCSKEPTIAQIDADIIINAYSFDELVNVSDLIIKAKVLPGKVNVEDSPEVGGHTVTKLRVLETFKGDVVPDEIVTITEGYYQDKDYMWTYANYLPAHEKREYIFFLMECGPKSYWVGMYSPTDFERGKYSLNSKILDSLDSLDSLSNSDLEIWIGPDNQLGPGNEYRDWYKQVIEKYCPNH